MPVELRSSGKEADSNSGRRETQPRAAGAERACFRMRGAGGDWDAPQRLHRTPSARRQCPSARSVPWVRLVQFLRLVLALAWLCLSGTDELVAVPGGWGDQKVEAEGGGEEKEAGGGEEVGGGEEQEGARENPKVRSRWSRIA